MAKYSVYEITLLLEVIGQQAGIEAYNAKGFTQLAQAINTQLDPSPYEVTITDRYIKETVFNQLEEQKAQGKDSLGLDANYVDTLCNYLQYQSFSTFQRAIHRYADFIGALPPGLTKLILIWSPGTEVKEELLTLLTKSGFTYHLYNTLKEKELEQLRQQLPLNMVLAETDASKAAETATALEEASIPHNTVFYLQQTEGEGLATRVNPTLSQPFVPLQDLLLFLAMIHMQVVANENPSTNTDGENKQSKYAEQVHTLILGNSNIQAEYFSNRDMHITIKKGKKK
jgi:hypothetical protein